METLTLHLNYDPAKLPEGFDATTSEGKRRIVQLLLDSAQSSRRAHGSEDDQIIASLTSE